MTNEDVPVASRRNGRSASWTFAVSPFPGTNSNLSRASACRVPVKFISLPEHDLESPTIARSCVKGSNEWWIAWLDQVVSNCDDAKEGAH